jgi:hypothetical protein
MRIGSEDFIDFHLSSEDSSSCKRKLVFRTSALGWVLGVGAKFGHYLLYRLILGHPHTKYCRVFAYWGLSYLLFIKNGAHSSILDTMFNIRFSISA